MPRHHVMKVLQEKGFLDSDMNLFQLVNYTEETFKSKFIDCHKDSVPGLADAYAAASAPCRVQCKHLILWFRWMLELQLMLILFSILISAI